MFKLQTYAALKIAPTKQKHIMNNKTGEFVNASSNKVAINFCDMERCSINANMVLINVIIIYLHIFCRII